MNLNELVSLPFATAYEVPDSVEAAGKFYRKLLKDQGWTELSPMIETDTLAMLYFEKECYLLALSVSREKPTENASITLRNHGNVDLRKLPTPPGAKMDPDHREFLDLQLTGTVDEAAEFYRKELPRLGWKEVRRRGRGLLQFTQNAVTLDLEIQLDLHKKTAVKLQTAIK